MSALNREKLLEVVEIVREGERLHFLCADPEGGERRPMMISTRQDLNFVTLPFGGSTSLRLIAQLMQVITGHDFVEVSENRFCRDDTEEANEEL